jgi:hypothetical protein
MCLAYCRAREVLHLILMVIGRTYSKELLKRKRSIFSLARRLAGGASMLALHHVEHITLAGSGICHICFQGNMTFPELHNNRSTSVCPGSNALAMVCCSLRCHVRLAQYANSSQLLQSSGARLAQSVGLSRRQRLSSHSLAALNGCRARVAGLVGR